MHQSNNYLNDPNAFFCLFSAASIIGTMPVGGVQSQNPTQGLVHWMSAVMAEHMTSNSHHDPTVGMHYMWNGGVDVSLVCVFAFLMAENAGVLSDEEPFEEAPSTLFAQRSNEMGNRVASLTHRATTIKLNHDPR